MGKTLFESLIDKNKKVISIVGLAKNTGKTVTLNYLTENLYKNNFRVGLISYGRDGEEIDLITGKKKPPVNVYPGSYFVTSSRALRDNTLKYKKIKSTDIKTTMGEVNLYQSLDQGVVQLVGINRISHLLIVKDLIESFVDYTLIDGALDRKSSALPRLSEAMILSTGAVIGINIEDVIKKTSYELKKIMIDSLKDKDELLKLQSFENKGVSVLWTKNDGVVEFNSPTSLMLINDIIDYLEKNNIEKIKYLFINGAFTDTVAKKIFKLKYNKFKLVVADSTKLFLNEMSFNLLTKNNIGINVLYPMNIIGLTINPYNPEGDSLDKEQFLKEINKKIDLPIYNIKA
ncbi:MAG: hypothetical protein U5K53_10555 [Halanaerobiales bacterium]|nr:hypothetical protein [Halanaerobiales bacterium]